MEGWASNEEISIEFRMIFESNYSIRVIQTAIFFLHGSWLSWLFVVPEVAMCDVAKVAERGKCRRAFLYQ